MELFIQLLGLDECADTILGNALLRGVSGGQKKRVTLGEMMITNARTLLLDEISTGLDSAVTFAITNALQKWTRIMNGTVVTSLLQPTPEVFNLFDDLILLKEGCIVYHGPRKDVLDYFGHFGIRCSDDQDTADFLVDFLTQPATIYKKQIRHERKREKKARGNDGSGNKLMTELSLCLRIVVFSERAQSVTERKDAENNGALQTTTNGVRC